MLLSWLAFSSLSHAQVGSGWTQYTPTMRLQRSGDVTYAVSNGVETFRITSSSTGEQRVEQRIVNEFSSGTNQFEGTFRVVSLGGTGISLKQTFQPESGAFLMVAVRNNGELYEVGGGVTLASNIIGTAQRLNTVTDVSARRTYVYVNGTLRQTRTGGTPPFHDKYGAYRLGSGRGPITVEWSNVRFWRGGTITGGTVSAPTFSPGSGTYTSAQTVSISTSTSGASIRYTTDGSTPSSSSGTVYSGPITISSTTTVRAIAYTTSASSTVSSATYTIDTGGTVSAPTFSPGSGTYTTPQTVSISTSTSGASIRYTTDGSTPSPTSGTVYTGPITISTSTTVRAIAYTTSASSSVSSASYSIGPGGTPLSFEAEAMSPVHSGTGVSTQSDPNTSGGTWISLDAENTGSWMEFTTPSIPAGTYQFAISYKTNNNRGIATIRVDGTQVGSNVDQYGYPSTYPTRTLGTVTFSSSGSHKIRMVVAGKNSSSSNYVLSADKFTFTPQ